MIRLLSLLAAALFPFSGQAETPLELWTHRFDPHAVSDVLSPGARAIAIDKSGYVAVVGFRYTVAGEQVYYTALHDPFTGAMAGPAWPRTYDFDGVVRNNIANAVAFDSQGNIIVTGESQNANGDLDYLTIKYDRAGGVVWSARYNNNDGLDRGLFVAVDGANNVIVTGSSFNGAVSGEDIFTIKYSSANGTVLSSFRHTQTGTRTDFPTGLAVDSAGKVIVCGATTDANSRDFYLAKYDMSTLTATDDWTRIFGTAQDDEAHDVVLDSADNVIVTGLQRSAGNLHLFLTRKYFADGSIDWTQNYPELTGDFNEGARSVAVDADGNVFVTGIVDADPSNTTFYTAKSFAATGLLDWSVFGPFVQDEDVDVDDNTTTVKIAVDPAGNPIIAGSPRIVGESADYYLAKYSSRGEGALLWEKFIQGGFANGGTDEVSDMVVDDFGNIAVTGDSLREAGTYFEILTKKFGATALATGDPIAGPGIPENAKITQVFTPAAAGTGAISARLTVAAGRTKLGVIATVGGGDGLSVPAVQNAAAPGITGAKFKSFTDPVMAPNGRIAFIGKVTGAKASEAQGVWTNAFNVGGVLELALQKGKQVPGMTTGVLLNSVLSISQLDNQLVALIKVSGAEKATVLLGLTDIGVGSVLFRTGGDPISVGGVDATIKTLTVFTPPKGSAGHGRYHGSFRSVARATLSDKRTAMLSVLNGGAIGVLAYKDEPADMVPNATWNTLSLPAVDTGGLRFATLGNLTVGDGDVTKANDSIIGFCFSAGTFTKVAREGDEPPGFPGAKYSSLQDPLVNSNAQVAFVGTASGPNVNGSNKTGLWFGVYNTPLSLIARTNHPDFPATDGSGADIDARWTSFKSIALPGGAGAGPLFLASIAGPDASKKTGLGLWALDSSGLVRKLIRIGDQLGDLTVKKFVVLQPSAGSVGVTRSFSTGGTVAVLVTFSDKSTGVLNIGIP